MTTIIFLIAILVIFIVVLRLAIKLFTGKPVASSFRALAIICITYGISWCIFYFISANTVVPFGTDVCFDDWCATITKSEHPETLGKENVINPKGQFIILHVTMMNHAKRISQKPSEPKVFIVDESGDRWKPSPEGQAALEKGIGEQPPLDKRLELHQSAETQLVFDIPKNSKQLKAYIEEGPFITKLILPEDRKVFLLQ